VANALANALAAAVLLAAFIGTGTSFLAFAVLAAKRQLSSTTFPDKSFYFLGGLTEATETLMFFSAMCVWPQHFAVLAYVFSALCAITIATRIWWGWKAFACNAHNCCCCWSLPRWWWHSLRSTWAST
jgi:hypothetical protein